MGRAQSTTRAVVVFVIIIVAVVGIAWWLTGQREGESEPEKKIEPEWTKERLYLGDKFQDIDFVGCIYTDGYDNAVFYWDSVLHFIPEGGIFEYRDWEIKVVKLYRTPVSVELKWRSTW